jgi:uncharacterized protein YjbI with pentapeptide repeats
LREFIFTFGYWLLRGAGIVFAMANSEHLARLRRGVPKWNQWRRKNPSIRPNLSGADLFLADLREVDVSEADLGRAILIKANLSDANLRGADLREADFGRANLIKASLFWANLSHASLFRADLSRADLVRADFSGADLRGADLGGAFLASTVFAGTNLDSTKGLESCHHWGPSSVGIDTIVRTGSTIPEVFLRGCGVPEPFIVNMKSLIGAMEPIQFYSCFISYSSQDQTVAERLHADLRAKNLRCWFAPEDLKIGDRFQERIEESIRVHDKLMIILSDASVQSAWVEREVNAAREREDREKRTILFPIRIDDAVMDAPQPWAADIRRSRHIGDFREWRSHDSYVKAFDRLLRDLKNEKAGGS